MRASLWVAGVVVLAWISPVLGDTLEKTNGQKFEGRVIAETADNVTFEVVSGGISFTQRVPRAQVRKLEREVREGPGYCAIPLMGDVGVEITAKALERALGEARRYKPQYIILVIDSNGGLISERDKLVSVLRDNQDLKIIAYVKKAYSAAATIALACPQMFIAPDGAIGAAVAYQLTPQGTPKLIEEKYQSAIRARERAASEMGKRSELWARGMSEDDLELSIVSGAEEGPRIVEGNPGGSTLIKKKGQILTATGREAVEWGMANGSADSFEALNVPLGIKVWHNEDKRPWQMMADSSRIERQHLTEEQEKFARRAARGEILRRMGPEVLGMGDKIEKARARAVAAAEALANLKAQYEVEAARIEDDYDRSVNGEGPHIAASIAQSRRQRALNTLQSRYKSQLIAYEEKRDQAVLEAAQLTERLKVMMASLPPE